MKNINELTPGHAVHPGIHLVDELEQRGLTTIDLQEKTRVIKSDWDGIIAGEIDINELYAAFLQMALDIDAKLWLALQKGYDEDKKKIAAKKKGSDHEDL